MLFNSLLFVFIFFPLFYFFYSFGSFAKYSLFSIILFSIIFYSATSFVYLPVILFSILFNFFFSKIFLLGFRRSIFLFLPVLINIFLLLGLKYIDFFIDNYNFLLNENFPNFNLPFPLALSFITFQQIAFLVDVYQKTVKEVKFVNYFAFVIFFPQLIAGPIVKFNFLNNQLSKINSKFNKQNFLNGLILISIGLFKKVILADNLSHLVNIGFKNYLNLSFVDAWISAIAFTLQLYYDFSGYVDIAIGLALVCNISLPENFNSPFKSKNIIEFWQRWHITLTSFITNYLYIPLVTSFKSSSISLSLFLLVFVFIIIGFWHGPSWCFIFFGFYNGLLVSLNHLLNRFTNFNLHFLISTFLTFILVVVGFVFFRSETLYQAINILYSMSGIGSNEFFKTIIFNDIRDLFYYLIFFSSILNIFCFQNSRKLIENNFFKRKKIYIVALMFFLSIIGINNPNEFIYFDF